MTDYREWVMLGGWAFVAISAVFVVVLSLLQALAGDFYAFCGVGVGLLVGVPVWLSWISILTGWWSNDEVYGE